MVKKVQTLGAGHAIEHLMGSEDTRHVNREELNLSFTVYVQLARKVIGVNTSAPLP